jgi:hypothetical protein
MDDVTHLFITYRECVRHLWNTYFCSVADPSQNWDLRDEFDSIARSIFSSLVLRPLDLFDHELAPEYSADPSALPGFRIVPAVEHGTPIFINRDLPRSGYWDHPVSRVQPDEVELDLLRFFDFDKLGCRDYRYFEVVVHASTKYSDIIGRAALIEVQHARVLFRKTAA